MVSFLLYSSDFWGRPSPSPRRKSGHRGRGRRRGGRCDRGVDSSWCSLRVSESKAVTAQTEESGVAIVGGFGACKELVRRVGAALLVALGSVIMCHRNAGTRGLAHVQRRTVAAEHLHRRPIGQHWNRRRRVACKLICRMNNFASHNSKDGFDVLDSFLRNREVIVSERTEVS